MEFSALYLVRTLRNSEVCYKLQKLDVLSRKHHGIQNERELLHSYIPICTFRERERKRNAWAARLKSSGVYEMGDV